MSGLREKKLNREYSEVEGEKKERELRGIERDTLFVKTSI